MIRAFLDVRKTNYPKDDMDFTALMDSLELALAGRPLNISETYLNTAKVIAINELGNFDSSRFTLSIKGGWANP